MKSSDTRSGESLRVLGISGSPEHGNTYLTVKAALMGAEAVEGIETHFVSLAGKKITPCDGCVRCLDAGHCVIEDDMQPLYGELLAADAIIIGTPLFFGAPSALCKAFLERVEGFGVDEKPLRLKVGGAIAVGAGRNGGQETAMIGLHLWFHINDMIPVGITTPGPCWGVPGQAVMIGDINFDKQKATNVEREVSTLEIAWLYGRKISTVTKIVTSGIAATGLDLPDRPYGNNLPETFPAELESISYDSDW